MKSKTTLFFKVFILATLLFIMVGCCKKNDEEPEMKFEQVSTIAKAHNQSNPGYNITVTAKAGNAPVTIAALVFTKDREPVKSVVYVDEFVCSPHNERSKTIGPIDTLPNDVHVTYSIGGQDSPDKILYIGPNPPLKYGKWYSLPD